MKLIGLKKVSDFEVQKWIEKKIPNLTDYQKQKIREDEIIRFAPFYFMEHERKTSNIFLRLTILFLPPIFILLLIGLPFNYFLTGTWGYKHEQMKWFSNWLNSCGL